MNCINKPFYEKLYQKYKKEFVIGQKSFLEMMKYISSQVHCEEVPLSFVSESRIAVFNMNYNNSCYGKMGYPSKIRVFKIFEDEKSQKYYSGRRNVTGKCLFFILEENTCYMESDSPEFDALFYIAHGIKRKDVVPFSEALMVYLNYFNMRDIQLKADIPEDSKT